MYDSCRTDIGKKLTISILNFIPYLLQAISHVNTSLKHFVLFIREFDLMKQVLIDYRNLLVNTVFPGGSHSTRFDYRSSSSSNDGCRSDSSSECCDFHSSVCQTMIHSIYSLANHSLSPLTNISFPPLSWLFVTNWCL